MCFFCWEFPRFTLHFGVKTPEATRADIVVLTILERFVPYDIISFLYIVAFMIVILLRFEVMLVILATHAMRLCSGAMHW